jgi:hypothetical protein
MQRPYDFIQGMPLEGYDALVQWIHDEIQRQFQLKNLEQEKNECTPVVEDAAVAADDAAVVITNNDHVDDIVTVKAFNEDSRGNKIVFKPVGSSDGGFSKEVPVFVPLTALYGHNDVVVSEQEQRRKKQKRKRRPNSTSTRQKKILNL